MIHGYWHATPHSYGATSPQPERQFQDVPVRYPASMPFGLNIVLCKSIETTRILGPQQSAALGTELPPYTTGQACIVDPATGDYDDTAAVDCDTSAIGSGLVFPNLDGSYPLNAQYLFRAIKIGDTYYAVSGGTPGFEGVIDSAETDALYGVTPLHPAGCDPILCKSLYTGTAEVYVVGQYCWVQMQGSTPRIIHGGCVG